jgi:hypothetical protein
MVQASEAIDPFEGLSCITFPWEVPERTIIVEYGDEQWRVVTRGRPVQLFRRREDALAYANQIAGLYIPDWSIIDRDLPKTESIAWRARDHRSGQLARRHDGFHSRTLPPLPPLPPPVTLTARERFAAAHADGMDSLRRGDYARLAAAVEREGRIIAEQTEQLRALIPLTGHWNR